jgi:alginate O-acetyltransferase complex protein AlgI
LGLGEKVILADGLSNSADPIFDAAAQGAALTSIEAWIGAAAYTFQIYFDFSGYSDMAIGLAYMFGIRLPINSDSPYKSGSIIDFWRRWHITLSRFLRSYLYVPLGGNRKGETRRYGNLMFTMLLGGLWHGAGWTFVAWGSMHGLFLVINHIWIDLRNRHQNVPALPHFTGPALSLFAVVVAWVFFRAADFGTSFRILTAMSGLNGGGLPDGWSSQVLMVGLGALFALVLPDVQQIMGRFSPTIESPRPYHGRLARPLSWSPNLRWAIIISLVVAVVLARMALNIYRGLDPYEYIYFQF